MAELQEAQRLWPVVVLTGGRQSGKTELLRNAYPQARFTSLDLPSTAEAAENDPGSFLDFPGDGPIIVDEVQYAPGLFRHIKARVDADRHRMGRFLLTGSQKFTLMKGISESLAGRAAILELETLGSSELLAHPGLEEFPVAEFLWRGGFPELYRNPELRPAQYYASYLASYLERDLRQTLQVGNLRDFERFVRMAAIRCGQLLNLTDLARDVGIAVSTARQWISALETSHLIYLLEPYYGNLTKRMVKTPKLYFKDTGLLCFLLGFADAQALVRSAQIGSIWECFVVNQVLRARQLNPAARMFFCRDAHGTEVDLLLELNGAVRILEVKWTEDVTLGDTRSLQKVAAVLGERAAAEHWIAARPATEHPMSALPGVRVVNGYRRRDWWPTATAAA